MSVSQWVLHALLATVLIKTLGLFISGWIVLRLGATRKMAAFWREYWSWRYVRENTMNLAFWVVTLCGYAYSYHTLAYMPRVSMERAFTHHPATATYAIAGTLWLLTSTILQTLASIRRTAEMCERVGYPQLLKKLGKWAVAGALFYLQTSGWPFMVGTLIGVVIPGLIIDRAVDKRLARAVEYFVVLALIEYIFRVSIVLSALYAETGRLQLW